jgi:hypothetical protein
MGFTVCKMTPFRSKAVLGGVCRERCAGCLINGRSTLWDSYTIRCDASECVVYGGPFTNESWKNALVAYAACWVADTEASE